MPTTPSFYTDQFVNKKFETSRPPKKIEQKIIKKSERNRNLVDVSWDSVSVERAKKSIEEGFEATRDMPFYLGDPSRRDADVTYTYTDEEKEEWFKCAESVVYFANKYCFAMTDSGIQKITLRDYQIEMLENFQENRFNILLCGRQMGKTVTSGIFLCWYLCFQYDKNVIIVANQGDTSKEILEKVKTVMFNLPFFLQPGVRSETQTGLNFDNGCKIRAKTTSKTAGIGNTCHLLFADEFAHIPENLSEGFYKSIFPTLSASQISRMIVASTPNGFNKFWQLWESAIQKKSSFNPIFIEWFRAPGRDEEWRQKEIENIGGEHVFQQEYECKFMVESNLLLPTEVIALMTKMKTTYINKEIRALDDYKFDYSNLKFHPTFDLESFDDDTKRFVATVDLADGVGKDYSVIHIFKLEMLSPLQIHNKKIYTNEYDFFALKQVGIFRSNTNSVDEVAKLLEILTFDVVGEKNMHIAYEHNFKGDYIFNKLLNHDKFFSDIFLHTKHSVDSYHQKPGVNLKNNNRNEYIQRMKRLMTEKRIQINEENTVTEFGKFSKLNNSNKYQGIGAQDDTVMSTLMLIPYIDSEYYQMFVDDIIQYQNPQGLRYLQRKLYGTEEAIRERKTIESAYDVISGFL